VKCFRHGLFSFFFYRVFELPLLRNAQKRTKKKPRKNILGLVGSSKVNQTYVEVRHFLLSAPRENIKYLGFRTDADALAKDNQRDTTQHSEAERQQAPVLA
jgi:hypothetical protein